MDTPTGFFLDTLRNVTVNPLNVDTVIGFLVLILLLILSGMMSGAESAYFSLSPADLKTLRDKRRKNTFAKKNLEDPERLLATILIANNLVNVAIVMLSTYLTNRVFDFSQAPVIGFLFQVVIITFLLLLFGEIMPKILATNRSLRFSLLMAYPLYALTRLFWPLNSLLIKSTSRLSSKLSARKSISMDELSDALDITDDSFAEEKKILKGIVSFGTTVVSEIMKPRIDVVAVEFGISYNELKMVVIESGYSRIPVYRDNFDSIKGVLYVKDLIPFVNADSSFTWQNLIREPYFVPESKRINDLFAEFQQKHIHLAIVVDEYGGTSGIVTLEDILEEIVGEISDESDDERLLYTKMSDTRYIFEGKVLLNDFCKIMGLDDDYFDDIKGDADTLAGLILEITGQFPLLNEEVTCKDFRFTIDSVDSKRIRSILVDITGKNEQTTQNES